MGTIMMREMCLGLLIGTMLEACIGAAVSLGMITGLVVGMLLPGKGENGTPGNEVHGRILAAEEELT